MENGQLDDCYPRLTNASLCLLLKLRTREEPYSSAVMFDLIDVPIKVSFSFKNFQVPNLHTA